MELLTRAEWGARDPERRVWGALRDDDTGHWNGNTVIIGGKLTWDHSKCASIVRGVQNFHMDERGWSDIAYNFVICPHGYVYEGRGLNVVNGANGTNQGNRTSHAIMWLSGKGNPFTDAEKTAYRETVRYISDHTDAPDRSKGHRDHKATECPGHERYHWIKSGMPTSGALPQPDPAVPKPPVRPILRLGMRGDHVRLVQRIIKTKAGGDIRVDGVFGLHTDKRVKDLQRFFHLKADGIVGPKTWSVLDYLEAKKPNAFGDWPTKSKPVLMHRSTGNEVRYLQSVITMRAGGGLKVDGVFGEKTLSRVKDVQRFFSLNDDGIVGPDTWKVIDFLANS